MRLLALPCLRGALITLLVVTVAACTGKDPVARGKINAFDSTIEVTLIGVNRQRANEITDILRQDLATMEAAWHAWRDGPVSRMNVLFNAGSERFAAPPSVLPLLRLSKALYTLSDGLFNPAIGHLYRAWGFHGRPEACLRPPPQDVIDVIVEQRPSMDAIAIDGFRVSSDNQTTKLDFRAIQRGYAIDQAIARLQELGVQNASVSIDGNLRAIGSRDGHAWSVAVRGPDGSGLLATLKIKGNEAAFTAAGDNAFVWEGRHYHDLIDPRSGRPAEGATSVTVLHPNASTANAAAAALFVAGPSEWHRIARMMGIRYVMLTDDQGRLHMNPAMQARVKLHARNREVVISKPLS
ncbi:MAG: FAD:protein FMN transferase [Gammaproteobacteria bacterium]|nr:FAD:protein FMN transferase [Gammaproteobacteria bacterium]